MHLKPFFAHNNSLSEVIKHFTPNWFAMTMGTGITAICLNTLQGYFPVLHNIATYIWLINIVLFSLMTIAILLRTVMYPESWNRMLRHSIQPMFLGCIPMGLATIINGFIFFGVGLLGDIASHIAIFLWYIDIILSILSIIVVPYYMFCQHEHNLTSMTGVWLLPFVACEVAAASGAILLPYMPPELSLVMVITCVVLWTASVSLAFGILVILFQRLALHKVPQVELASTMWLPLGPMGTGSLVMFLLGDTVSKIDLHFIAPQFIDLIHILHGIGLFLGVALWTAGTWWLIIALLVTCNYIKNQIMTFNLGFWGYTFPLGVYIMASTMFAKYTQFKLLGIYAVFLVCVLTLIWVFIFIRTLTGAYRGSLIKDSTLA